MAIIRTGTITVVAGGAAQKLNLGFLPDTFYMRNDTIMSSGNGSGETMTGVVEAWYDRYLNGLSTAYTIINTTTDGAPVYTRLASATTGITSFQSTDANLFVPQQAPYTTIAGNRAYIGQSTNLVITGIDNSANASVTATHSFTSSDVGVTVVTFHGVLGMTQINGLSGVIQSVTSTTSFTVNINSTNFGTYSAGVAGLTGGFANVITGAPADTLYGNALLPTAQANLGFIGLNLGTSVMVNTSDVWFYTAIQQSPVTGP